MVLTIIVTITHHPFRSTKKIHGVGVSIPTAFTFVSALDIIQVYTLLGGRTGNQKGEHGVGKIIPSTSVSSDKAVMSKRLNTLANIYLDRDASRSEQINTANAVVASNLAMLCAKRPDLRSYDECMNTTYDYFNVTSQKGVRPTISGIALAFGLSRSQFLEACESGQVSPKGANAAVALPNEVWNLFVNLRDNYISMLEGFLESNVIHPSAGMFLLKNNSDYKDVVEKKVSVTNATIDLTALAEKYKQELSDFE